MWSAISLIHIFPFKNEYLITDKIYVRKEITATDMDKMNTNDP